MNKQVLFAHPNSAFHKSCVLWCSQFAPDFKQILAEEQVCLALLGHPGTNGNHYQIKGYLWKILGVPVTPPQLWPSSPMVIWRIPDYLKKVPTVTGVAPALRKLELACKKYLWMLRGLGESMWFLCHPGTNKNQCLSCLGYLSSMANDTALAILCSQRTAFVTPLTYTEFFWKTLWNVIYTESICHIWDVCMCVYTHTQIKYQ